MHGMQKLPTLIWVKHFHHHNSYYLLVSHCVIVAQVDMRLGRDVGTNVVMSVRPQAIR